MTQVIGNGSDSIDLKMAEDQQGGQDAEFTVNVDGQQIGGVQSVSASQSNGQTEDFIFNGNYDTGTHNIAVTFVNNWSYPGTPGDRNLYVDGVTYDGQTVSNTTSPIYESPMFPPNSTEGNVWGNAVFQVNDTTPSNGATNDTTTPGAVSVGSGSDTLVLNMAEDAYQGDAQFTVAVDGQQIGGVQTTTAIVAQGQAQEFDVHGNFGGGGHNVTVTFLNDKIGAFYPAGTPGLPADGGPWAEDDTDRNLYVMGAKLNGGPSASGAPWELSNNGSYDFSVTAGNNPNAGNATITSDSLNAGTSTSPTFLASPSQPTVTTPDTTAADPLATATTDGTTSQDFSVPTAAVDPTVVTATPSAPMWTHFDHSAPFIASNS